jgi:Flp pilus assembly protein TadD
MDRNSEALAVFEQAVALEPGRPDALFGRGISKKRLGREAEGNADIDAALAKDGRVQARFAAAGLKR